MTNDSKLALVLGIVLVMLMGIVFFRRDSITASPNPDAPAPANIKAPSR